MSSTVKLSKPIVDQNGTELSELTLKEPSGEDYLRIGDPYRFLQSAGQPLFELNRERLLEYVAASTGVHLPLLKRASMRDIRALTDRMFSDFFSDSPATLAT